MSNFNQYFKKEGANIVVNKFFTDIDAYHSNKMTDMSFEVIDDNNTPASYYIENRLSATFKVRMKYKINYEGEYLESEFEVPKEIDGAFIIEGSYRIATNTLGNDYDCRINMSGSGRYDINFDYDRVYDINKKVLKIKRTNPELGLPEKVREYSYDDIDGLTGIEKEVLKLSDRQATKFQVKLDLDYRPEYISTRLINDCIAFGDDRMKDLIIDKKIESVSSGFINFLLRGANGRNFYGTRNKIRNYWTKNGKLIDQVNVLTFLCIRYWKGSSDNKKGGSDLQISPGINAMNLESLTGKIQVPKTVAYNTTFSDLICLGDTPINQNVGKQNSLTVSTHITDDGMVMFDVYDLDYKKITVPYLDYLNKKVAASEYVDYEGHKFLPNSDGKIEAKYRLKRIMVPVDEIELIDMEPDYRLSETVRRVPFINYCDSVRIHMGTSMLKQSIPLVNAERPLVDTGNVDELKGNVLNESFKEESGVVKDITEKEVIIELPNKSEMKIPRRSAIQSIHDVAVYTEPKVKVGQIVKKGDIITGAVGLEKDTYKMGINTLVLFHAMFGYVNEDALVVSESYAKKMCSYSIIDLSIDVKATEAIQEIAPIGTRVKSKDSIVTLYKAVHLDDINKTMQDKLGGLFGAKGISEYMITHTLDIPNDIEEAYISDVLIQENKHPKISTGMKKPDLTFTHTSKDLIDEYESGLEKNRQETIYKRFPEYVAADRLKPISLTDKSFKVVYTIRVRLIKRTNIMKGSKITNRYGGKGVVSKILADNQMPVMVDENGDHKIIDVVMNPYSTINRKITSVNLESLLGRIAHRIHDLVDEYKVDVKKRSEILPLVKKYYPGRFDSLTLDEFLKKHENSRIEDVYYFNVGCFSKFTPQQIDEWAKELNINSQCKILMPCNTIADLDELRDTLSPEEYEEAIKGMEGRYTEVDRPLTVGYMTLEQLYQIPTYSNKVTSSMFGVDVNEFKDSPILGHGSYRTTGQKIGEMELSCLLARGVNDFIVDARGDTAAEDNQEFLNNMLALGLTISDSSGYPQGGSSLKSRLGEMKTKFRLKNQK